MFKVGIIGRPNVGKSTLFNKMVRKHQAITNDMPGVTRDYNEGICKLEKSRFIVIDSPGWGHDDEFSEKIKEPINRVLKMANLVLFVIESELTTVDQELSLWLRKNTHVPVILLINKCERKTNDYKYELGWNNVLQIAAQHNIGLNNLYDEIAKYNQDNREESSHDIKISIVGRPNVGKSTFINQLLKENRVITSTIAGTTRDSISINWPYKGKNLTLIDTAGIRKKAKIKEEIESWSIGSSINAIRQSDVVILMLDSTRGLEQQDMSIIDVVISEGKSIVIAINKADIAEKRTLSSIQYYCEKKLLYDMPVIITSALENKRCNKIIDVCVKAHKIANQTIPTTKLNKWLSQVVLNHAPPLSKRKTAIRLKFIKQTDSAPLTFKIFANIPEDIDKSYVRYLTNTLREAFRLEGAPIRIHLEKNHNPYVTSR